MQRVKLTLVCLSWLLMASAVSAQTAVDPTSSAGIAAVQNFNGGGVLNGTYFDVRHMIGDGVGYQNSYSQIGAFTPIWLSENSFIAPNVRLIVTNSTQVGVNAGGVGRTYVDGWDRIFGVYSYYDSDEDSRNFRYNQVTVGAETLGQWWDLRGNGYLQVGNTDNFMNAIGLAPNQKPFFVGNNIDFIGRQLRDQSLGGADVEIGTPVSQNATWLRAYGGAYGYRAGTSNTIGFRGRLEANVSNDLTLGVQVTQDALFGTNVNGTIDFKFSGFQPTIYFPNMTTRQRMLNPVQRNWRIATRTYVQDVNIAAINPDTNKPYFITHVDNSAAPGGDGSFEHPYQHLQSSPQSDIILVHAGNATTSANPVTGSVVLVDNQRLLGDGIFSDVNLIASYGSSAISGIFQLPNSGTPGVYPYVTNPLGDIVTLANNNEVAGLNLFGAAGSAITNTASGSRNFNLHNLEITGNMGKGIALTNASGSGLISNINVGTTNHLNPDGLGNNAGGGIQISTGLPGLDLQMANVYMNSNPAGTQPFGVSLAANTGYLNANMYNVVANGNGVGIQVSENSQLVNLAMNRVRANNNTGAGIQIQGTGGNMQIDMTNVAAMGNGSDNLQIGTQAAPIVTSFVNVNLNDTNFNNSTGGSGIVFSQSGGGGNLYLFGGSNFTQSTGNAVDGMSLFSTNSNVMQVAVHDGQFQNNGRDAFHVEGDSAGSVSMFIDPTNASGSGRDALYFSMNHDSNFLVTLLNNNFNNSGRSAIYGQLQNTSYAQVYSDQTSGSGSGANGLYLNASGDSLANITINRGSFANSGRTTAGSSAMSVVSDNSRVNLLTDFVPGNNRDPLTNALGTQDYGLSLNLANGSLFNGSIQNGSFSDTLTNAINATVASGSTANLTLFNTAGNNSGASGFVANVDNATFNANFTAGSDLNNSGQNGMTATVTNGGQLATTFDASSINNSAQDGMNVTVTGATSVAGITIQNGGTVDNSGANGLNFNVNAGTFGITALSSSFSNSGTSGAGSGVLGVVTNGGMSLLEMLNTTINNNRDNGIFVTANTGGNVQAVVGIGSVSGNGTTGITANHNDGIRLDLDAATNSLLQVINGASVNGNGNDGVSILANNGTIFQGTFGNGFIVDNGVAGGATNAGVNLAVNNASSVGMTFNGMSIGNSIYGGTQQTGFLSTTDNNSLMTASFTTTTLNNNTTNAMNSTVTTNSQVEIDLANTTGTNSLGGGAVFNVNSAGQLLVMGSVNSGFSNNGSAGLTANVDGAGSVASFGLDMFHLDNNGNVFGGAGFNGVATNGGNLNACLMGASTVLSNANQGIQLTATNPNSLISFNVSESDINYNGSEGVAINVTDSATVNYRSMFSNYLSNGSSGTFDGINVLALGNGPADTATARLLFSGDTINGSTGNGMRLEALNGATLTTVVNDTAITNNGGYGILGSASGTNTEFDLIMTGSNTLTGNTLGPIGPMSFSNIAQAALVFSGTFDNSPGDGVNVSISNVQNALVAFQGPGTVNNSAQDGIDISLTNVTNGSVLINGVTQINGSGGDGIKVAFNNVANGAIGLEGKTQINGSGDNGIDISVVNSNLVDNMSFGGATLSVLTLSDSLPTPLNNCLPTPVDITFNSLGVVPTQAFFIDEMTVTNAGSTGISIVTTNSTIQTMTVSNDTVGNIGGDGIHFNMTNTPVTTLNLIGNTIGGATGNGVNFDLNGSPIGTLNIANNSIGIVGGNSAVVGDTLPIIIPGLNQFTMDAQDDIPSVSATLGFAANFFGTTYSDLFVNYNGNVTFGQPNTLFTPFGLTDPNNPPIIAPFFADVDTRTGNPVTYGTGTIDGHNAFAVNWIDVKHFDASTASSGLPTNTFQLVLIDRSDVGAGDFDIEFNYQSILWETGEASGGNPQGLGGQSAHVGYSNGDSSNLVYYDFAGSGVNGALLDGGPAATSLIQNSLNSIHDGRYIFFVRDGLPTGNLPNSGDGIRLNATNGSDIGAMNVTSNEIANSGANGLNIILNNSNLSNPVISQNNIHNNGGDGVRMVNPITSNGTLSPQFTGNTISNNGGTGVNLQLVTGAQNLNSNFAGNTISSNTGGAGVNIQLADNRNFTGNFANNTISSNHTQGVNLAMGLNGVVTSDFTNNTISSNTQEGINLALKAGGGFVGNNFYGNTISNNGSLGVRLVVPDLASYTWNLGSTTQNANVLNQNVDAGVGITMTGASNGTLNVANTSITKTTDGSDANFSGEGLKVTEAGSAFLFGGITNSTFTENAANGALFTVTGNNVGIFAQLNNFTVNNSIFNQNQGNGLEFFRTADGEANNISVLNSTFNTNAGTGLVVRAANKFTVDTYTINGNTMNNNGANGVLFDERADANLLVNMDLNVIQNNNSDGIRITEQVNSPSDLRGINGIWTRNLISSNSGNGILVAGATSGLYIGDVSNTALGNVIQSNDLNGIQVTGAGTMSIGSNTITDNGTLANLGTANENAGLMLNVSPYSNITVVNNEIAFNKGDGIQWGIQNGYLSAFSQVSIDGNMITNNNGRGVDVINRADNRSQVNISNNFISANDLEGVYVVNTASASQDQFSSGTTTLAADGALVYDPILELRITNNQIIGNGLNSPMSGTGLVIRVGTSGGGTDYNYNNPGGFASNGAALAVNGSPFGQSTFFGGVTAVVDSNTFGGNFGNDIYFNSFVSTVPVPTTQGTWDQNQFTITGAYQADPLSRFDLYFRNNVTDPGATDFLGVEGAAAIGPSPYTTRDPSQVAFYNNAEGIFKSRQNPPTIVAPNIPGPFINADRARNATRQAGRLPGYDAPLVGPGLDFLYPGIGASTWRVSTDSIGSYFQYGVNVDFAPYTNTGDAVGQSLVPIGNNGELPFGFGTF